MCGAGVTDNRGSKAEGVARPLLKPLLRVPPRLGSLEGEGPAKWRMALCAVSLVSAQPPAPSSSPCWSLILSRHVGDELMQRKPALQGLTRNLRHSA